MSSEVSFDCVAVRPADEPEVEDTTIADCLRNRGEVVHYSQATEYVAAETLRKSKLNGEASWTRVIVLTILVAITAIAAITTSSSVLMILSLSIGGIACLTAIWMMSKLIKNRCTKEDTYTAPEFNYPAAVFPSESESRLVIKD